MRGQASHEGSAELTTLRATRRTALVVSATQLNEWDPLSPTSCLSLGHGPPRVPTLFGLTHAGAIIIFLYAIYIYITIS